MDLSKIHSKEFWCEFVTVTPKEAADILKNHNANNREISRAMVRRFSQDMANQKWLINGDSIKFSKNGKLVDGQHRLTAIVELQQPLKVFACGGMDPEVFATLDVGKKRTLQDVMRIAGVKNYINAAATTRWLIRLHQKNPLTSRSAPDDLKTPQAMFEYFEPWSEKFQLANKQIGSLVGTDRGGAGYTKSKTLKIDCPRALAIALRIIMNDIDEEEAERFFVSWNHASDRPDLVTSSPTAILAEALSDRRMHAVRIGARVSDTDRLLLIVTTWNAWIRDDKFKPSSLARVIFKDASTPWPGILGPKIGEAE